MILLNRRSRSYKTQGYTSVGEIKMSVLSLVFFCPSIKQADMSIIDKVIAILAKFNNLTLTVKVIKVKVKFS